MRKQERVGEALVTLESAVDLAKPGGGIRPFVEMGPQMADLLNQLHSRGVAQDFVAQILAAFPAPQLALSTVEGPAVSSAPQAELVEPLTEREIETLRLPATDLSTQETAAELVVEVATVRTHSKRIYGKLEVHSRFEAVERA